MNIIKNFFGWHEIDSQDYDTTFKKFGGNIISNPNVLAFLHNRFTLNESYYAHRNNAGDIDGAICVWNNKYIAGEPKAVMKYGLKIYPLNFDEIILPISEEVVYLPFKTKHLSGANTQRIINKSHLFNAKRRVCIVKQPSSKTRQTRKRELRKFIEAGGTIKNISEYSREEYVDIFDELYFIRRGSHINKSVVLDIFNSIPNIFVGNVLEYNGSPCATQLIASQSDNTTVYFDYVNSGRAMELDWHPIGTISLWTNIMSAQNTATDTCKKLRFSFGRPTADYKHRWCTMNKLYRLI